MTTDNLDSPDLKRGTQERIPAPPDFITQLDQIFPALYTAVHAACSYLRDHQGIEPFLIALDLDTETSRLYNALRGRGLIEKADITDTNAEIY